MLLPEERLHSDPDYILIKNEQVPPPPSQDAAVRRAHAMHQWTAMRTDGDYCAAVENVYGEAWRVFWALNRRTMVTNIRVFAGEPLVPMPLTPHIDRRALRLQSDDPLVAALASLSLGDVLVWPGHNGIIIPLTGDTECAGKRSTVVAL